MGPLVTIMESHAQFLRKVRQAVEAEVGAQPSDQTPVELFDIAERHGLISAKTKEALVGATVMRNLAAHAPGLNTGSDKAREFVAITEATAYALRTDLKNRPKVTRMAARPGGH